MIFGSGASERHPAEIRPTCMRLAGLAVLLCLGACGSLRFLDGPGASPPPAATIAAAPADPLGRFAAEATPGMERPLVLADGRPVRARLLRRYAAASGRTCSEVLVASTQAQRTTLVCEADGQWAVARPLLGGARP